MLDQGYRDFFPLESLQLSRTQVSLGTAEEELFDTSRPHPVSAVIPGLALFSRVISAATPRCPAPELATAFRSLRILYF